MFFEHLGSNDYICINRLKRTVKLILTSQIGKFYVVFVCLPTFSLI